MPHALPTQAVPAPFVRYLLPVFPRPLPFSVLPSPTHPTRCLQEAPTRSCITFTYIVPYLFWRKEDLEEMPACSGWWVISGKFYSPVVDLLLPTGSLQRYPHLYLCCDLIVVVLPFYLHLEEVTAWWKKEELPAHCSPHTRRYCHSLFVLPYPSCVAVTVPACHRHLPVTFVTG